MSTLHHNAADKGVPMTLGELRQFVDRALGFEDDAELFDLDGNPIDRLTLADKTEAPAFDPNAGTEQPWYQAVAGARAWGFKPGLPGTSVHESVEAGLRRQHALTHVDGTTCPTCAMFDARTNPKVTATAVEDEHGLTVRFDAPCAECVKERTATGNTTYRCTDCRAAAGEDVHSDTPVTPMEHYGDNLFGHLAALVRANYRAGRGVNHEEVVPADHPEHNAFRTATDRLMVAGLAEVVSVTVTKPRGPWIAATRQGRALVEYIAAQDADDSAGRAKWANEGMHATDRRVGSWNRDEAPAANERPGASNDDLDGKALDAVRQCANAETGIASYHEMLRVFPGITGALNKALARLVKGGTLAVHGVDGYRIVQ